MAERDPKYQRRAPEEYQAWAREHFPANPEFCARHWAPCPVGGRDGVRALKIVLKAGLALVPADVTTLSALNSWRANQLVPTCCRFGDDVMARIWARC